MNLLKTEDLEQLGFVQGNETEWVLENPEEDSLIKVHRPTLIVFMHPAQNISTVAIGPDTWNVVNMVGVDTLEKLATLVEFCGYGSEPAQEEPVSAELAAEAPKVYFPVPDLPPAPQARIIKEGGANKPK